MEPLCETNEIMQKYNTVDTENNYNFWKEEKFGTGRDDKQVINFLWPKLNYMKFSNTSPLSLVSTFCWKFLQRDAAHNQFSSIFKLSIFRWDLTRALDSWRTMIQKSIGFNSGDDAGHSSGVNEVWWISFKPLLRHLCLLGRHRILRKYPIVPLKWTEARGLSTFSRTSLTYV